MWLRTARRALHTRTKWLPFVCSLKFGRLRLGRSRYEGLLSLVLGTLHQPHDRRRDPYYWLREKITSIVVATSTGSPLSSVGLYFHCCTASIAARTSSGCPERTSRDSTEPALEMIACRRTVPEMRVWRASGGYTG